MVGSSILKKIAVSAAVAAGAVAVPTAAQATPTWDSTGDIKGFGTLVLEVGTMTTTCDIAVEGTASNVLGVAKASLDGVTFGTFAGGSCSTNLPNCLPTVVSNVSSPWTLTGSGSTAPFQVGLGGISYVLTYTGSSCHYHGMAVNVWGSANGVYTNPTAEYPDAVLRFSHTSGVTSGLGPGNTSGEIYLYRDLGDDELGELALS